MVQEIGRRLINGVWVTDTRDESGSTPTTGGLQVIGPFEITFATPANPLVLFTADPGDLLLDLFLIPTVSWSVNAHIEVICDSQGGSIDLLDMRQSDGDLVVSEDATRYTSPTQTVKAYLGPSGSGVSATPTLFKISADVNLYITGSPIAGEATIWGTLLAA